MKQTTLHPSQDLDRSAALVGLAALGTAAVAGPGAPPWFKATLGLVAVGVAALSLTRARGSGAAVPLLAGFLCLAAAAGALWQLAMPLALLAYFMTTALTKKAPARGWWVLGRIPWPATALCALVTPVALLAWVWLLDPDVADLFRFVPDVSLPALAAGAAAFALFNAAGEELIWRGMFQDRLTLLFGPVAAVAIQAASFGVQHAHGFPRGFVGAILAGIWAIMLGWLRIGSGGILAPIVAHVVADAAIAVIVIAMARH